MNTKECYGILIHVDVVTWIITIANVLIFDFNNDDKNSFDNPNKTVALCSYTKFDTDTCAHISPYTCYDCNFDF